MAVMVGQATQSTMPKPVVDAAINLAKAAGEHATLKNGETALYWHLIHTLCQHVLLPKVDGR